MSMQHREKSFSNFSITALINMFLIQEYFKEAQAVLGALELST